MSGHGFEILSIDSVEVQGSAEFAGRRLMSPYVWAGAGGELAMLVRVVDPKSDLTGSLWFASGDGLSFRAGDKPVLSPEQHALDCRGCEDPTVIHTEDECLVYYTGVRHDGAAQLLWAAGPNIHSLRKRGIAHASTAGDRNTKEATVKRDADRWLLLFEYSSKGHSRIGRVESAGPAGPWNEQKDPFEVRPGRWDGWHLSTGPLLIDAFGEPVMFYNGANAEADWAIGWVQLDRNLSEVRARSDQPLIAAPDLPGPQDRKMVFAASAVTADDQIWLYFTHDDRTLKRATLRWRLAR